MTYHSLCKWRNTSLCKWRNTSRHRYLKVALEDISRYNNNESRLAVLHADGDGHCLVL